MTGTLVNAAAIIAGTLVGLLVKKGLPDEKEKAIMKIMGLAVIVIGINGVISSMFTVGADGTLSSSGELLMVVSLIIGTIAGEYMNIDEHLNRFGQRIEEKTKAEGFAKGFISATILYCVGAMAIIGSLNDGLMGDSSVLFIKGALDGTMSIMLTASLGIGVAFSAIPVLLYQGTLSLLAGVIAPFVSGELLNQICSIGYVMVIAIGINLADISKIKVANLLPGLLVPVAYQIIQSFLH